LAESFFFLFQDFLLDIKQHNEGQAAVVAAVTQIGHLHEKATPHDKRDFIAL
jgi:hypothetical protein